MSIKSAATSLHKQKHIDTKMTPQLSFTIRYLDVPHNHQLVLQESYGEVPL